MSGKKKSFVLRLSPAMMEAVEKWAADEFRSANGQLEWLIAEALKKAGRWKSPASPEAEGDDAPDAEA
jgi:hypothetical protein